MAWQPFRTALIWFIWGLGISSFSQTKCPGTCDVGEGQLSHKRHRVKLIWLQGICIVIQPWKGCRVIVKISLRPLKYGAELEVVCWAKLFTYGMFLISMLVLSLPTSSFLNGPCGQYPTSKQSVKKHSAPTALPKRAFLFGKRLSLLCHLDITKVWGVVLTSRFQLVRLLWNELVVWVKNGRGELYQLLFMNLG